jgi:G:T-mismatch repair DNA endonuclease (very short patch repair protein)
MDARLCYTKETLKEALKNAYKEQSLREKATKHLLQLRQKHITKIIKALHSKPNKLERRIIELVNEHNLPLRYVGNGEFVINGRNPDFISTDGTKKVIEVFGNYWHSPLFNPKINGKRTYRDTLDFYRQHGYDCLILWEDEIYGEAVIKKIKQFLHNQT